MKENPAPGAYEAFPEGEPRKGKTFGISYKHYEKVMIPKEEKLSRRPNQSNKFSYIRIIAIENEGTAATLILDLLKV
jgi:hypothetical protein